MTKSNEIDEINFQSMPLRFRVWDNEDKVLIYDAEQAYDFMKPDHYPLMVGSFVELIEDERYTISQDTGLKDKNGNNIYAGDILKVEAKGGDPEFGTPVVVEYRHQRVQIRNTEGTHIEWLSMYWENELEVIGNIWQNSDLLDKK